MANQESDTTLPSTWSGALDRISEKADTTDSEGAPARSCHAFIGGIIAQVAPKITRVIISGQNDVGERHSWSALVLAQQAKRSVKPRSGQSRDQNWCLLESLEILRRLTASFRSYLFWPEILAGSIFHL